MVANPNFVCTICSQTFTRRWRGKVHNSNIHEGQGKIVRLIDYMIGRRSGEYLPRDPALYRHKSRSVGQTAQQPPTPDKKIEEELYFHSLSRSSALDGRQYQRSYLSEDRHVQDPIQQKNEAILKMAEIKKIAFKHLSPVEVNDLLSNAFKYRTMTDDNHSLDIVLEVVRKTIQLKEAKDSLNSI